MSYKAELKDRILYTLDHARPHCFQTMINRVNNHWQELSTYATEECDYTGKGSVNSWLRYTYCLFMLSIMAPKHFRVLNSINVKYLSSHEEVITNNYKEGNIRDVLYKFIRTLLDEGWDLEIEGWYNHVNYNLIKDNRFIKIHKNKELKIYQVFFAGQSDIKFKLTQTKELLEWLENNYQKLHSNE